MNYVFSLLILIFLLHTKVSAQFLKNDLESEEAFKTHQHFFYMHKLNYMLPYYYTSSPYRSIYHQKTGTIQNNQEILNTEFKGQISIGHTFLTNLFYNEDMSIDSTLTELIYWQSYTDSPYFRSTDLEINLFYKYIYQKNWLFNLGIDHQSNGKGDSLERSWNRAFSLVKYSDKNFYIQCEIWGLIFQSVSSDLHNPDIEKYLGHDIFTFEYRIKNLRLGFDIQNIENILNYGNFSFWTYHPITDQVNFFIQYFNGYGQSLIEYNHLTQGIGVGVLINN